MGFPGPVAGVYKLEPERFSRHLAAIEAAGVCPGLIGDGTRWMLTFDDGGASALQIASLLERRGWRGTFFVVAARIGTSGFLDAGGVRELAARGHEVGSHSHTHPAYMARLRPSQLADEWKASRAALADVLGAAPPTAAVPGGSVSREVVNQASSAGYRYLFTSTPRARPSRHGDLTVVGRYTIWANDPPARAAALIRGDRAPRGRRWLGWQLKSAAKRLDPKLYETVRAARARRR